MQDIIDKLNNLPGLKVLSILNKEHKELIKKIEERNNLGVLESINRDFTLLLAHDSNFRKPVSDIVLKKDKGVVFPPIPFPEVGAKDVVSSSPSKRVHDILRNKLKLNITKEATLLVGFNL